MESASYVETEMSLSTCEMMSEAIRREVIRCNQASYVETERQRDRETERQRDRETERQREVF